MNVYNKMVQNKRGKMLILTILLTLAALIKQSTSINLTYIVKKEGEKLQPSCIAEEEERYSAIGWVYPLPEKEENGPHITTKFIPSIENNYNCKFSKNDKCTTSWSIVNWHIDENSTRTLDLTFDSRWEDFPTFFTGNDAKEFKDRVEVPNVFRAGFSLRASDSVELLICQGWNPYTYPCYHLNMNTTHIFLRKYATLPKNISDADPFLDYYYKTGGNILSGDEWRNFILSLDSDGILSLNDVNVNRTVIQYHDKDVLKPVYLLVRSTKPALWKIHQNNFLYTKTAQISRLGPALNLPSKSLCVSLYVSTCEECTMTFFMKNSNSDEKKYFTAVGPTKEYEWQMIKLKDEQIQEDNLHLFVETKFVDEATNMTEGFWAIDDVRICHENEVKVTFLKLKNDKVSDEVSCQVVRHPQWRPRTLVYSKIEDFPDIDSSANATSITLNWTQQDPNNEINYFIAYQANDLCLAPPFNLRRIKSNGFLRTKHNEIIIKNLVPYTKYNLTFTSMLHENEKKLFITTMESELPTPEELPSRLQIRQTDTQAYVSWDKVGCESIYGHLLYSIQVTSSEVNSTKEFEVQTGNTIEINDLEPFTDYTFNITTARNFEDIQNNKNTISMTQDFKTLAGIAPSVKNLEVYSADKNSVSFRYDLPRRAMGKPILIQVLRCSKINFYKCKPTILNLSKCKLWPKKFCFDIENLIPNQHYTFKVSIKNADTKNYGKESVVDAFTTEHVPGSPTNLTYKMVDCAHASDYCHLNVSWSHPYNQNGTITSFLMDLNATDDNITKDIQEILQISNKTYLPQYEFQIKYIPYSTHYELYVQSANSEHKSSFTNVHIKTDDIGEHINQNPIRVGLNYNSVTFKLPHLDPRLTSYTLTMVVQDFDRKKDLTHHILKVKKVASHLCHRFGNTWILPELKVDNTTNLEHFTIGTEDVNNKYLEPNTQYCITFIVTNKYKHTEHNIVYVQKLKTPSDPNKTTTGLEISGTTTEIPQSTSSSQSNHLYILLVLLLLVPVGFLAYWYFKKRRPKPKKRENKENAYESLPFEDCEENCANNDTYDHLLHK